MGWKAQPTRQVQMDDCAIPGSQLLGEEGRGFDTWREDVSEALVIIGVEGKKAFCAGGDIADLYRAGREGRHGSRTGRRPTPRTSS